MKLTLALLVGCLAIAGCSQELVPPGDGPRSIDFKLVYPAPVAPASYYGVSGVRLITAEDFRDTVILVTSSGFYAQFFTALGASLPASVELNSVPLKRHLTTDTLRFDGSATQSAGDVHTWRLIESAGQPVTFASQPVHPLDSVAPLFEFQPLRADTSLTLTWRPPTSASNGVLITWRSPGIETYSQVVSDVGKFVIPASVVGRFVGTSELILARFRTDSHTYLGKPLFLTRVAQRNYIVSLVG